MSIHGPSSQSRRTLKVRLLAVSAAVVVALAAVASVSGLSYKSAHLIFPPTKVGAIRYQMATITNDGASAMTLTGATRSGPFWPTWGGTCNSVQSQRVLPAGQSCTFQFGFNPSRPGWQAGIGTIAFDTTTVYVLLEGRGTAP